MKSPTLIIFCFLYFNLISQETNQTFSSPQNAPSQNNTLRNKDFEKFSDRLYLGGNVGAWFGTTTYVNLSPAIGCMINKKFSVGVTATYNYYSQKYYGQKYVSTIYGGGLFSRYLIFDNIFAQVNWERLSVPDFTSPIPNSRAWIDNILLGGGLRQKFSDRGMLIAAIFYNINQTPLSPYQNPIIQIGFNIGL